MFPTAFVALERVVAAIPRAINPVVNERISIHVDIDVAVVPVAVTPCVSPGCAASDARTKPKPRSCDIIRWVIVIRRIRRIPPFTIDRGGIIRRDIDSVGAGGLDGDVRWSSGGRRCLFDLDDLFLR